MSGSFFVGCAGWALRREAAAEFPGEGTHLARYARRLPCVEINSSFYRPHRVSTYERWAASTPAGFRFAVKVPKQITHERRLVGCAELVEQFLGETAGLGAKLGAFLVQLPPSLAFDEGAAAAFFGELRCRTSVAVVCEPRHATWFTAAGEALLVEHDVGRVAADPSVVPAAAKPGGDLRTAYFRWHGSPRLYWSSYDAARLEELSRQARLAAGAAQDVWCVFDNTAAGAATENSLQLLSAVDNILEKRSFRKTSP